MTLMRNIEGSALAAGQKPFAWLRRFVSPRRLLEVAVPALILFCWHFGVLYTKTRLIPTPIDSLRTMYDLVLGGIHDDGYSGSLPLHVFKSVQRVYAGFAAALILGVPTGMLIGRSELFRSAIDPTLRLLRPIPVTAWLPLAMIFFGVGPRGSVFLVFLGSFFPIVLNTTFGVRSVDARLVEAAEMLGCRRAAVFTAVILPGALPAIMNGIRLGHALAWFLIVVGEMTGVPEGLGALIMDGRSLSRTDLVICGMAVIGAIGFVTDQLIIKVSNRLLAWSPQHHA